MGITDEYVAYCFDEAVGEFGNYISAELEKVEGKDSKQIEARQEMRLKTLLGVSGFEQQFAQPVPTTTRPIKELEDFGNG